MRLRRLVLAALTGVACSQGGAPAPPAPAGAQRAAPANGEDLLRRMHDEYATTWYATLTFVQTATFADGRTETWYEALQLPGRLRIDVAPVTGGNATIFRNDSVFSFAGGKRERSGAFVHPLLVLGFDVYRAPVEETIAKVRGFRVDLSKLHSSTWQGRPVWIVGADAGDSVSTQFWVDAERLVFVRMLERRVPAGGLPEAAPAFIDTRFNGYQRVGGGWIAPEVLFFVNGRPRLREVYSDIRADVELPERLFEADEYRAPDWVK